MVRRGTEMVNDGQDISLTVLEDTDATLQQLIKKGLESDQLTAALRANPKNYDNFSWKNRLLFYEGTRIYIPEGDLQTCILQECHDCPAAGHFSVNKMTDLIIRHYYWPAVQETVWEYIQTCDTC